MQNKEWTMNSWQGLPTPGQDGIWQAELRAQVEPACISPSVGLAGATDISTPSATQLY